MTKAIAVVAALQLVEQNKISLDEPLDDILPEMSSIKILDSDNQIVTPTRSITLRHLLTHTAGFGYWFTSNRLKNWQNIKKEIDWDSEYRAKII
jgi:CubicO group peptidase (beta-lactamase class C family)